MAILLSDGTQLFETGTDARGFTTFVDDRGRLITNQDGRFIISSENIANNQVQFAQVLNDLRSRGDEESAGLFQDLKDQFFASLPPQDAFNVRSVSDFLDAARDQAGDFFAPDRGLIEDSFKLIEQQARETKDLLIGQGAENLGAFESLEDRSFARTLTRAQGKFAGLGTATSGVRRGAIDEEFEDKEERLEEQRRGFAQFISREDLDFSQLLGRSEIEKRRSVLNVERREEDKAQRVATERFREQNIKDKDLIGGFARFINQKAAA